MQLTCWLGFCALVGGVGVVLHEPLLGGERFVALTGANSDLPIIGGAVALIGVLTLLVGDLEYDGFPRSKGSSS